MNVTDRRLPWLPSIAGSVVIHGAFAALTLSALPQLPPLPEETQISIAPLDTSFVNPLQSDEFLEATPVNRSSASGPQEPVGVARPITSAQSAPASAQQSSATVIETGMAAPFAVSTLAPGFALSDSAAPLEPAAVSSLPPSVPPDRLIYDTLLPLDTAQLPSTASQAPIASALAEQRSTPLPVEKAEALPIEDNAFGPVERARSAKLVAVPEAISPLDASTEAKAPPQGEVADLVSSDPMAALPPPLRADPPSTMLTAASPQISQTAGPFAEASPEGTPMPAATVTAATLAPSTTTVSPAGGVTTDLAASLPVLRPDAELRSSLAEALDTSERVANELPTAVADQSVPNVSVVAADEAVLAAAPPSTVPAAEQVEAERIDAGAVAAPNVSPTLSETIAPTIATTQTAGPVRTVTIQFVKAGDRADAVLPTARTAAADEVGGNALGRDRDRVENAGNQAAPISRQVFAAPGPFPGAIAARPVTPPTLAEVAEMVRGYSTQECFAADVGTGPDGLVQVTGYGQARTIAAFAKELRAQMGTLVPLSTTVVSDAQCTVLEAMQNWTGYPATGPTLELSSRQIASGATVTASVPGAPTEWVYLLLVNHDGTAIKLAEYVAEAEGATRSAPPVEFSGSGDTPQLMVSVVSPTALTSMAEVAAQPVRQIFQALESELERRQIRATLSVAAFTVR
jgi:hypothetical protein